MASLSDFLVSRLHLASLGVPHHWTHYVQGKTLLSTSYEVWPTLVAYLVIIFGIQAYQKDKQPLRLQFLFRIHNAFLSSGSLLLVLLILEEVLPQWFKHGTFYAFCNDNMWSEVRQLARSRAPPRADATVTRRNWNSTI